MTAGGMLADLRRQWRGFDGPMKSGSLLGRPRIALASFLSGMQGGADLEGCRLRRKERAENQDVGPRKGEGATRTWAGADPRKGSTAPARSGATGLGRVELALYWLAGPPGMRLRSTFSRNAVACSPSRAR